MAITDILSGTNRQQLQVPRNISTRAVDVVGIFRPDSLSQIVPFARPMTATVVEGTRIMTHPVENGSETTDHIIFLPVEIELPLMALGQDFQNSYETLNQIFRSGTYVTVQTRTKSYENMLISDVAHEESALVADGALINVRFTEVNIIEPEYGDLKQSAVENKNNSSTIKRGAQQTTRTNPSAAGNAKQVYDSSKGGQNKGSRLHQWFGSS